MSTRAAISGFILLFLVSGSIVAAPGLAETGASGPAAGVDAYNVIWGSPSVDHHGSMPLGNGDIALNAWVTSEGDVRFCISSTILLRPWCILSW